MRHLYSINEYSEIYVADSVAQAVEYYRSLCDEDPENISQLPDDERLPECSHCGRGGETHAEYAAQFDEPVQVFTGYN